MTKEPHPLDDNGARRDAGGEGHDLDGPGREQLDHEGAAPDGGDADARLAEVLRGDTTSESLRHSLVGERSNESEDLIARLDALDFVNEVVGGTANVPTRIAEYEIKGLLGRGGMGTVYLGYQQELEREVAIKVLSPNYSADPTMQKRFRAEARATAALHHRHIVPIYDYGESQGMMFFTMERVDGMSLDKHIAGARRLRRPHMDPVEAAHRFAGVADALGLAHRRRLLHRDVKPGNILVAGDGTLALTDFGLAKALDNVSAQLTSKGGGFLGTLHYSSPEQALGDELTPASDLYALGVTIFETVSGQLPFAAKTTEALLSAILHGTPRRLRELVPKAPRDLDAVLEKLLSREPADRYQDGEALARDLLRIRDGEPVHIRRLPLHTRILRRARKNPGLASAIAAAAILLLVTLVLLGFWRTEKGHHLVSRHQVLLQEIANGIGSQLGGQAGPAPLLEALTGIPCEVAPADGEVLKQLATAHAELPDDPMVRSMERAYVDDPLPSASRLLREGRGYEAWREYQAAITDAVSTRTGDELDVELALYRLFLGRAVANLTQSMARVGDAQTDLALAGYLRPGAIFPKSLLAVLRLVDEGKDDIARGIAQLRADLVDAAAERRRIFGRLLWCVAGLCPTAECNMMEFELGYADRRRLHEFALELLGEPPPAIGRRGRPTGLAAEFARRAAQLAGLSGDPVEQRAVAAEARAEVERSVHPDSPMRGWSAVLQLVAEPQQRGELLDADGEPLPPAIQVAAWRNLLVLPIPPETLSVLLPRFDEDFFALHSDQRGVVPIAARLHMSVGDERARTYVDDWIEQADTDPQALLLRMRLRLQSDDELLRAADDAMVVMQRCVDKPYAMRAIVEAYDAAYDEASERVDWARMAQLFPTQSVYKTLLEKLGSD